MSDTKETGFKVTDKRHHASEQESGEATARATDQERMASLPPVTFATLVLSLNTSALVHLGDLRDPTTGESRQDVILAKHAIDTLSMLKVKTEGNLDDDEKALLENVLYDLQMRYVRLSA